MTAYYNEIDPYAAQWLRNLIAAGHIAPGVVDERSIVDVRPADLAGFSQCHFFAGIGVWSYALRLAGWPDSRPVWTASCPCQPFSAAGKRGGIEDERHLWPEVARLVRECGPGTLFGEQVASKDGLAWLDTVHADLEAAGYAVGALDTCAAGFGAPHIRQRLYFVADATLGAGQRGKPQSSQWAMARRDGEVSARLLADAAHGDGRSGERKAEAGTRQDGERRRGLAGSRSPSLMADTDGRDASTEGLQRSGEHGLKPQDRGAGGGLAYNQAGRRGEVDPIARRGDGRVRAQGCERPDGGGEPSGTLEHPEGEQVGLSGRARIEGATRGHWHPADWLACIDGKARPVEPGTFPLAYGIAGRVGRLRAYGNCIVAPQAAEFIGAYRYLWMMS